MLAYEQTGEKFNLTTYFKARELCIQTTDKIISQIEVGMNETDIKEMVEENFRQVGVKKFWHPTKIRIGQDTVKTFRELSNPDLRVKKNEICFVDFGPIIDEHEADYGRTFLFGTKNTNHLIQSSEDIFQLTAAKWKSEGLNGIALYQYASNLAYARNLRLNPLMSGHRLGDFPHKLFSSEKLFEIDTVPTKDLWVLEIHVIDEKNNVGAFFEDILS
ncbi:MAG: M24 family metallopeptidase [Bacteriovoracaceae bacterium]|nr:M24 family metallopeptidase [Bacteriovoracaceae bacterium]